MVKRQAGSELLNANKANNTTNGGSTEELLALPVDDFLRRLNTSFSGLTSIEAENRIKIYGSNELERKKRRTTIIEFFSHLLSPLVFILLFAGLVAGFLGDLTEAIIIFVIVGLSEFLDSFQEIRAERAAEMLKEQITTTTTVLRDGAKQEIKLAEVVPGDILYFSAGDIIPADSRVVSSKDLNVDQSALTGESFPVDKSVTPSKQRVLAITEWENGLFQGTSVITGTATAVVIKTGMSTEFGRIAQKLVGREPTTAFERGLRRFGFLMMELTFVLVIFVFFINALFKHTVLESLLFSLALAVGLTPELLPMIISITLSKGALAMSKQGVIIKRLRAIENFGSMDVLCTDKTGTLTENKMAVIYHRDLEGNESEKVLLYSFINSHFETGLKSPFDEAILKHEEVNVDGYQKVDEIPFDFTRRRSSIVVDKEGTQLIVTKGAPEEIIKICPHCEFKGNIFDLTDEYHQRVEKEYYDFSSQGFRVLGISYKKVVDGKQTFSVDDEKDMVLLGFVAFLDPPKETAKQSLQALSKANIELKILTGDNEVVTRKVCEYLDFEIKGIVLGNEMAQMNDDGLRIVVERVNVFARVTPSQKDRIMNALKNNGHVVGFLGDGINDAPSLKTADTGISVDNAADVAKEAADIILCRKDLDVLNVGVLEGRRTFGNTIKYILMGTSSNFGNMFSAAAASFFLPFIPMLPTQILFMNLLYDISNMTLPTDNVDEEYVKKAKRWDISFIKNFTIFFGPFSSIYDFLTFGIMLFVFGASQALFQSGWFVESFWTEVLIMFVIRTRRIPFFKSRPGKWLTILTLSCVAFGTILPFTLLGGFLGFTALPPEYWALLILMVATYLLLVDAGKVFFYKICGYEL